MNRSRSISKVERSLCGAAIYVILGLLSNVASAAPAVEFNSSFLVGGAEGMDLSRFESNALLPGTYSVDVRINGTLADRRDVEVRSTSMGGAQLCLSRDVIALIPLDQKKLAQLREESVRDADGVALQDIEGDVLCSDIGSYVPGATADLDSGEQVLELGIPHALLQNDPRGWVAVDQWDEGVNAMTLGYSAVHQRVQSGQQASYGSGMVVNAGLNLGAWRFRHDGYATHDADGFRYNAGRTSVRRNLPIWGAQLTLGEASTNGDLFDAVPYRGVSIETDPRMLPDSLRDFAPVVRGIARTNARVTVRQNGHVLQDINVAPGPFEIQDLLGTAYAGNLDVEVVETDGTIERFSVPFSAVPQLLRPGQKRYSLTAGELHNSKLRRAPNFVEATLRRGISNRFTVYGGLIATEGYAAGAAGLALNTGFGALSAEMTHARTQLPADGQREGSVRSGQSFRFAYSKNLMSTRTNIALAAYRYSTEGYLSLNDASIIRGEIMDGGDGSRLARQRSRLEATLNQRLGNGNGSLFLSGSTTDYWNRAESTTSFSAGYTGSIGPASFTLSAQRRLERSMFGGSGRQSNSVNLSVSVPLGGASSPRLSASSGRSSDGFSTVRAGINGVFGDHRQGAYNAAISHSSRSGTQVGAGGSYALPGVMLSGSLSAGGGRTQQSLGASGGIVLHADGVVLSQQLNDTIGILEVPNAAGARVTNVSGLRTNKRGMAVVPYLSPYRRNEISVDPAGLHRDVELGAGSVTAVPTAGAVVKMVLPTTSGRSALIEAPMSDGTPLPFGVDVMGASGKPVGVVGQASRIWVRGIDETGTLSVRWGEADFQHCSIDYDVADATPDGTLKSECVAAPAPGLLSRRGPN